MQTIRRSCLLLALLAGPVAATEWPAITPQVSSVFPHGGRQGSEVAVELRGAYLDGVREIRFSDPGFAVTVKSSSFRRVDARFQIAPSVETGRHEFQVVTGRGLWFGVFRVDSLEETFEREPNNSLTAAQAVALPVLVNGRADGADADYYRFSAEAGQTVVFDVMSTRLGSALDPALWLFDENGRELAYNDDAYRFKDARLVYTFQRKGTYSVLVSASFERSAKDADYRLLVTSGPFVRATLPLGGRKGSDVEVTLHGWNLQSVDRVWLKPGVEGRILERSATAARVLLRLPPGMEAGAVQLHASAGKSEAEPVRFEVSDLPEVTAGDQPTRVTIPVIVNGLLPTNSERIQRVHWIEFEAGAGARYELRVDGWGIGQVIDPVVSLFAPDGKLVAQEDDPAPNSFIHHPASHDPRLVYVAPHAGKYRIQVRDAAYEGGGGYRLTMHHCRPGFEVEVRTPQLTIFKGQTANLLAVIRRTGGVHVVEAFHRPDSEIEQFRLIEKDGWNQPIRVWAEGVPAGVSVAPVAAEPRNTTFKGNDGEELFVDGTVVELPVRAAADAEAGLYEIRVVAEGAYDGRTTRHPAKVLNGPIRSMRVDPTRDQKLYLNVLEPPALFWTVPAEVQISKAGHGMVRAGIVRFSGKYKVDVAPMAAVPGFRVSPASAGPDTEEVELEVEAIESGGDAVGRLVLSAAFERNGRVERVMSPPIELRMKP